MNEDLDYEVDVDEEEEEGVDLEEEVLKTEEVCTDNDDEDYQYIPSNDHSFSKLNILFTFSENVPDIIERSPNMMIALFDNWACAINRLEGIPMSDLKPCPPFESNAMICDHVYVQFSGQIRASDEEITVQYKCHKCGDIK